MVGEVAQVPCAPSADNEVHGERVVLRLLADVGSALAATSLIAPIICLIDKSIVENASGRSASVLCSVQATLTSMYKHPRSFWAGKPLALIFMTYGSTYVVSNIVDTTASVRSGNPNHAAVTSGTSKFLAATGTNTSLGLVKDRSFARTFGTGPPRPVPLPTLALFTVRDAITIFFSFNLPPLLVPWMPRNAYWRPESYAQFIGPAVCQFLSTPFHLLGLDLYNKVGPNVTLKDRAQAVRQNYLPSSAARMCRIVPAFGFGGVGNKYFREYLMGKVA